LDQPLLEQVNFLNRWKYMSKKFMTQFGLKYLQEDRLGGQMAYDDSKIRNSDNGYGIGIHSERAEIYHKMGFIPDRPSTSFGFIQSGSVYDQTSFFGLRVYEGNQKSYYSNLIFQTYIGTTDHNISTGLSFIYDEFHELVDSNMFNRIERVPGAYFQYTYTTGHIFTAIAGVRADYHNLWGLFYTPRVHLRYQAYEDLVLRASGGKGYRTASVFAENTYVLANSRRLVFLEDMKQEEAWNFGLSATQDFHPGKRDLKFKIEYYRTDFINQVIVDMDADISEVRFYNLEGRSFSNSFQIEASYEPIKRLDVTAAYRLTDVRMDINDQLQQKPLVNRYKGLLTFSYITKLKKWQFDLTAQLNGDGRLPQSSDIPATYRTDDDFPAYYLLNTQITKYFKKWEVYAGGENLTNYIQKDPIIASDDPYGPFFDASRVWGPLMGRKIYLGIRYTIN
ncbi:MAG: TonB-dependent receptor, partial [Bacteroidota bacterium]